jgi:hypothetical protein
MLSMSSICGKARECTSLESCKYVVLCVATAIAGTAASGTCAFPFVGTIQVAQLQFVCMLLFDFADKSTL